MDGEWTGDNPTLHTIGTIRDRRALSFAPLAFLPFPLQTNHSTVMERRIYL